MTKLLVVLTLVGAHIARAAIDLTPTPGVRELEGCKFPQLEFSDGPLRITYESPRDWTYAAAGPHLLTLRPAKSPAASAKIELIENTEPLVFDDAEAQRLQAAALQTLPPGGQVIGEAVITPNPLRLNDHATCELEVSFSLYGQKMRKSTLLVDLGKSQLRFVLSALESDYKELHKAFSSSWYSWQWLTPAQPPRAQNASK